MEVKLPPNVLLGSAVLVNRFQMPDGSDAQVEAFYAAIGKAVCAWQSVEGALSNLFETAINIRAAEASHVAAKALFFSAYFSKALEMTEIAVCDLAISGDGFSEWFAIREGCEKLAKKRNILVHSAVVTIVTGDPPVVDLVLQEDMSVISHKQRRIHVSEDKGAGIKPREMSPKKKAKIDALFNTKFDANKILEFAVEFEAMSQRIAEFTVGIMPRRSHRD